MRLALVHGFTQTGQSWAPVSGLLQGDVVCPDLPGHGSAADIRADVLGAAHRLADEVGPAIYVGYSMGGRVCLSLAVHYPDVVAGLVLVSTSPGIAGEDERAARRAADEELARQLEADGVAAFTERWLAGPLWATLPRERAGVDVRLTNTAAGLASSLRLAGTGAQPSLWTEITALDVPVLVVTGALDTKFSEIGVRMTASINGATHEVMAGAGHALPWEQPEAFAATVTRWVDHSASPSANKRPNTS
jgi:2-succinyl-6-hydroxy-2,4-cyclohexadiene-1-carboxylate synthase